MPSKIGMSSFIPMTSTDRSDIKDLGTASMEILSASFSTISSRTKLMGTQSPLNPKMIRENRRMVTEKLVASFEVGLELQIAWMSSFFGDHTPWWKSSRRILEPLHSRTTRNAKRLS